MDQAPIPGGFHMASYIYLLIHYSNTWSKEQIHHLVAIIIQLKTF